MNVKIEKQENSKVLVEFTMPKDDFKVELDKAFKQDAKKFKVPGFRNGKVPRDVVEKYYGEAVLYQTVIENTVDDAYRNAIEENKLEVVSRPEMDIKEIGKDKDFIFTVTFYVKPEATVRQYKGLEIEKVDTKVTKKDIEKRIEQDREKNARIITVEDRKLQDKDISTIDFEGFLDGVAFEGGKGENYELVIGSGSFIPGFEKQLIGMEIGEDREIKVTFPEEYHAENLAGKEATFKVKLISIKVKELPELDDEFAKDISEFETLAEYKKDVEKKEKEHKEAHAKADREARAIEKLVENTEVVIPESMIEDQLEQSLEQFRQNLAYQGLDLEMYCQYVGTTVTDFKETLRPQAERDVKLNLALEYIIATEKVDATDEEIDSKIEELVSNHSEDAEKSDSFKKNQNIRDYMKKGIIQEKALKVVVDNVVEK